jgi:4-hydroxy-tetrahydrodipicolinate reductase
MKTGMKLGIAGCTGRMGRLLVAEALAAKAEIVAATVSPHSLRAGEDIGILAGLEPLDVKSSGEPASLFAADVVIDFTTPEATARHLDLALVHKVPLVIGTTGLSGEAGQKIAALGKVVPVLVAANFSRGVNLLLNLVEAAARALPEADVGIYEMHHRHKKDSPSGTALALGSASGNRASFAALRGGSVVGDHTVTLALEGERIELTHRGENRAIYAKGAVAAAQWLIGKPPGVYSMRDVLAA